MKTKRTLKLYNALDNGNLVSYQRNEAIKQAYKLINK